MDILKVIKSGHWPSLLGAWLHLTVSFMVWLLVGAMSIALAENLQLNDAELAWLVALPLLSGAAFRLVAGWSADWVGARPTALAILGAELALLLWGRFGVFSFGEALVFAFGLGVAGASFAVSLPMAGRAYPPAAQGLVLGLAASGNVGTVLVLYLAPRWATVLGWHQACGLMAGIVGLTLLAFAWLVPRDRQAVAPDKGEWWHHVARLIRRRSAYWLCFLYGVTFGGFVGLCSILPLLLHDVYRLGAVQAGGIAALCVLLGSIIRPLGGHVADRQGGLRTLHYVLPVIAGSVVAVVSPAFSTAIVMMVVAAGAMGFGNGVVFQLVAEWFPEEIGLASGVVGAAGSVGGFLLPITMGSLKGLTGSYEPGLWLFAGFGIAAWGTVLLAIRGRDTSTVAPLS
jgi:NNP family nitrate/nitrite transporter-like MFS transporter